MKIYFNVILLNNLESSYTLKPLKLSEDFSVQFLVLLSECTNDVPTNLQSSIQTDRAVKVKFVKQKLMV